MLSVYSQNHTAKGKGGYFKGYTGEFQTKDKVEDSQSKRLTTDQNLDHSYIIDTS